MIKKLTTEAWLILILKIAFIIFLYIILSDWANFKAGFLGGSPV